MDEAQSLDALANILDQLSQKPYDISLHAQHIRLAQSNEGLESQVHTAQKMLPIFLAAGEDVWVPPIEAEEKPKDLDSFDGLPEVLALYVRVEADYLCTWYAYTFLDKSVTEDCSNTHTSKAFGPPCQSA
jgi:hypothetical protein